MHTYTFSLIHSTKTGHLLNARAMPGGRGALGLEWACGFWKAYLEEEAFQLGLEVEEARLSLVIQRSRVRWGINSNHTGLECQVLTFCCRSWRTMEASKQGQDMTTMGVKGQASQSRARVGGRGRRSW